MPKKKEVKAKAAKAKRERNPEALGIAGFTLGIMSLVLILFSPALGSITAIVGFFFCLVQHRRQMTRTAKIGMILNGIGFVVNVAWWVVYALVVYPLMQQGASVLNSAVP